MAQKEKVMTVDTRIQGVWLVVTDVFEKIASKTLTRFWKLVANHRQIEKQHESLEKKEDGLRRKLIEIVSQIPGLRGLQTQDGLRTNVFKSVKVTTTYNRELLKESLGAAYEAVVAEDLEITINLTPEHNQEEILEFLRKKFPGDEFREVVRVKTKIRVDGEELKEKETQGQVSLKEGARVVEIDETWNVKTVLVKK